MSTLASKWVDGPWALIETPSATKDVVRETPRRYILSCVDHSQTGNPAHYIANEMAYAHNAMLRGLNAIYLQAPYIPPADVRDFLFFASSWAQWVLHHHELEEQQMFPMLEAIPGVTPGSLQRNTEQHHEFSEGLSNFHKYAISTDPSAYSGAHIRDMIDSFAGTFRTHLAEEIGTLWAMETV